MQKNKIEKSKAALEKLMLSSAVSKAVQTKMPYVQKPGYLQADPERSLVFAEFDKEGRLVLTFDDGNTLRTRAIENLHVEQFIGIKQISGGSTAPSDINVRLVSADTDVTADDDIIVATAACTITLLDASVATKTVRIKRFGAGDVTVHAQAGQTIDNFQDQVLNVDLYSIDVHPASATAYVIL